FVPTTVIVTLGRLPRLTRHFLGPLTLSRTEAFVVVSFDVAELEASTVADWAVAAASRCVPVLIPRGSSKVAEPFVPETTGILLAITLPSRLRRTTPVGDPALARTVTVARTTEPYFADDRESVRDVVEVARATGAVPGVVTTAVA